MSEYADYYYKGLMDAVNAAKTEGDVIKQGSETFKGIAAKLGKTAAAQTEAPKASKVAADKDDEEEDEEEDKKASAVDPLLARLRAASAK